MPTDDAADVAVALARAEAAAVAQRASIVVREATDLEQVGQIVDLFDRLWGTKAGAVVSTEHLWALVHGGNYAVCAYDLETDALLAASYGFFTAPPGQSMHSDVTGAEPTARDRGLGMAIKLHQRAWALALGLAEITWTFDPLMSRNAYFNLAKLGADATAYHVDFYGDMDDGINAGQGSDRLLARWSIADPVGRTVSVADAVALLVDDGGRPSPRTAAAAADRVTVAVPRDIQSIRRDDPDRARGWRLAVREILGSEIERGSRVVGFAPSHGYIVERASERLSS
jgi:predicted GNAT superfamily acetyltransferase